MFLSVKDCEGKGECVKNCPTEAIRHIEGKSFSCICCGACYETCPNHAIFKNKYGGYVVDKAKCNGCGVCEFTCPIESIHIEDGVVKGICSRCGVCEEVCPDHARRDVYELVEDKQQKLLNSLKTVMPKSGRAKLENINIPSKSEKVAKRICVNTNLEECELCGRCSYYCPTGAIKVDIEQESICTNCRVCEDICPSGAIKSGVVNSDKCSLCLNCYNNCPNNAIVLDDFTIVVNKLNQKMNGTIISCINCGLCSETLDNGSIRKVKSSLRYDPYLDKDTNENKEKRLVPDSDNYKKNISESQQISNKYNSKRNNNSKAIDALKNYDPYKEQNKYALPKSSRKTFSQLFKGNIGENQIELRDSAVGRTDPLNLEIF